jgi:hypothetical protein
MAPKRPKAVKDAAMHASRQGDYDLKQSAYMEQMNVHHALMGERRNRQTTAANAAKQPTLSASASASAFKPFRDPSWPWAAWVDEVEYYARRCGADEAQLLWENGAWSDTCDELNGNKYYQPEDRKLQFERLEGLGTPPSEAELKHLPWPQCGWWTDRDRIVLFYEDDDIEKGRICARPFFPLFVPLLP